MSAHQCWMCDDTGRFKGEPCGACLDAGRIQSPTPPAEAQGVDGIDQRARELLAEQYQSSQGARQILSGPWTLEQDRAIRAIAAALSAQPRPDATFAEWLATEMPAGTIIGDPVWWANRIARQYAVRSSQPPSAPVGVDGLHPETADLVRRFAQAVAEKLGESERKYGWDTHWKSPAWMDQCREQLVAHVAKGDPRDVAAYAAFLWHHGEQTALAQQPAAEGVDHFRGVTKMVAALNPDAGEIGAGKLRQLVDAARHALAQQEVQS